jgi:aspartyl-tRNA(Asn)/glutamyl-tRNA(Gln) amidotransferase subunit C
MSVSREEVLHIASLAHLHFEGEELAILIRDLNEILTYMDKLNELDTSGVAPLSHPVEAAEFRRDDVLMHPHSREDILHNAPDSDDKYFHVPKVIK